MLVNTTSNSLQLNQGAVSQSLLKMGGPGLQIECSQKYPNGIQVGEVAETSGAKLECKLVCHGALPGWNGGSSAKVYLCTNRGQICMVRINIVLWNSCILYRILCILHVNIFI